MQLQPSDEPMFYQGEMLRCYMALLRLTNCDPVVLQSCGDALYKYVPWLTIDAAAQLLQLLDRVAENYYPISNQFVGMFTLGKIYFAMGERQRALVAYSRCI